MILKTPEPPPTQPRGLQGLARGVVGEFFAGLQRAAHEQGQAGAHHCHAAHRSSHGSSAYCALRTPAPPGGAATPRQETTAGERSLVTCIAPASPRNCSAAIAVRTSAEAS